MAVAAVVLLVALAAAAVIVLAGGDDGERVSVVLEPREDPSDDPFTESVVIVPTDAVEGFSTASGVSGGAEGMQVSQVTGELAGLYGGVADGQVCDREALVDGLLADPTTAAAWATVVGVDPDEVEAAVDSFAAVVLGRDTVVTNHALRDGRAEPFTSVLQAGTAVLVDDSGVPRVRCACGNPLLAPDVDGRTVDISGEAWDGFDEDAVTEVAPSPAPLAQIETVDVATDEALPVEVRPVGEGGEPDVVELDGLLVSDDQGVHVVSEDGASRTTVIDHPVAAAYDDGAGGVVFQDAWPPGDGGTPPYPEGQVPQTEGQAQIWSLPAGATEPVPLVPTDDPSRRWSVLEGAGVLGGRQVVAYAAMTFDPAQGIDSQYLGDLVIRDIESGEERTLLAGAYGWESGTSEVTFADEVLAFENGYGSESWNLRGADLAERETPCRNLEGAYPAPCPFYRGALIDPSTLVGVESSESGDSLGLVVVDPFTGELSRPSVPVGGYVGEWMGTTTVDGHQGRAVVSFAPDAGSEAFPAVIYDHSTGSATEVEASGTARLLRAPLVRPSEGGSEPPAPPGTTSTTTTTTPQVDPATATEEEVAVAFVEAAMTGGEVAVYTRDDAVAADADEQLPDSGAYQGPYTFDIDPTYVDPLSQGGEAGECQLTGDITLTCAVAVGRPGLDEPDAGSLIAVNVTSYIGPGPDELTEVDPHVVGFEIIAS